MASTQTMDGNTALARTALVAGEVLIPGTSNIIAGNIGAGLGTLVGTGVAIAVLAPLSPLLAGLAAIGLRINSYKLATTGTSMMTSVRDIMPSFDAPKNTGTAPKTAN
ncbi:hypothetical protein QP162_05920 [Sphingomonas aurantiaca]|uniref:Uncharacterized protein n=1 Tax=Sphingomonas aurantiaca TaxID=185949 RepID=A0A2T5GK93_9SPHN|nr:hypothetical protein [Sphingomonas aurantiaca]PTQ59721.1 hypothetical protein C8J26_2573 [Sphingomonas aurantiaca]